MSNMKPISRRGGYIDKTSRRKEQKPKEKGYEQVFICKYCKDRVGRFMSTNEEEMKRHISICQFRPGYTMLCSQCDCQCTDEVYKCSMTKFGLECPFSNHIE